MPLMKPYRGIQLNKTHPLARGLVGCWLMNEATGTQANDFAAKNDLSLIQQAHFIPARFGSGIEFDGDDSGVGNDYLNDSDFSLAANSPITVVLWAKVNSTQLVGGLLHIGAAGITNIIKCTGNWYGTLYFDYGSEASGRVSTSFSSYLGQWVQIVLVGSPADQKIYLNGVEVAQNVSASTFTALTSLHIGRGYFDGWYYFGGVVDHAILWSRCLTASEITSLYRKPFQMFEPNPIELRVGAPTVLEANVYDSIGLTDAAKISRTPYSVSNEITSWQNAGYRFQRKLARTSNGDLHCIYVRTISGYSQICYAKSIDNGQTWSETQITSANYNQYFPTIAVDSSNVIHVAWVGTHTGSETNNQLRYCKYTDSWQLIQNLSAYDYGQVFPSIAVDSNDYIHIVWAGRYAATPGKTNINYILNDGSWQAIEHLTTDDTYNQNTPTIAIAPNDNVHVFWYGKHAGSTTYQQIRHRVYTDSWQTIEDVTSDSWSHWDPCCAIDSSGNLHLVYTVDEETVGNIKYRQHDGSWQAEVDITSGATYSQIDSGIAIDASDYLHVLWEGYTAAHPSAYQLRYRLNNGSWQDTENLTDDQVHQRVPNLMWAWHPVVSGSRPNRTAFGYALIWANDDVEIRYLPSTGLGFGAFELYDSVAVTDEATAEIISGADLSASVYDELTLTDETEAALTPYLAAVEDDVTVADAVEAALNLYLASAFDSIGLTDEAAASLTLYEATAYDELTISEYVEGQLVGEGILNASVYDSITLSDESQASLNLYLASASDELTVTDAAEAALNLYLVSLSDDIGVSDYTAASIPVLLVSLSEDISLTDEVSASIPVLLAAVSDALGLTDEALAALTLYEVSVYDGLTLTDAVGVYINPLLAEAFDALAVAEFIDVHISTEGVLEVSLADLINVTDYAAAKKEAYFAVAELLHLTDAVMALRLPDWTLPSEASGATWSKPADASGCTWSKVSTVDTAIWTKV